MGFAKLGPHLKIERPAPQYLYVMSFTMGSRSELTYDEIRELALSMPAKEKQLLAEELERQGIKAAGEHIFRSLKPDQVSEEEVIKVSEQVRKKLNARRSRASATRRV